MRTAAGLWLLAAAWPALAGNVWWQAAGEVVSAAVGGVSFLPGQRTAVVAAVGQSAELNCSVLGLGDKAVSWVRSRDLQILTHAGAVFTADARVAAAEAAEAASSAAGGARSHALRIARLRADDAGRYECQVNTHPKLSLFFDLTVLDEPPPGVAVAALGARVVRGRAGGAATLACEARYRPAPRTPPPPPPLHVSWHRLGEDSPLDLQSSRGGVSLDTERWGARLVSRLTLAGLRAADAGRYRCRARAPSPAAEPAGPGAEAAGPGAEAADTVTLLLDDGDSQVEAMQRDQSALSGAGRARALPALGALALALAARAARAARAAPAR